MENHEKFGWECPLNCNDFECLQYQEYIGKMEKNMKKLYAVITSQIFLVLTMGIVPVLAQNAGTSYKELSSQERHQLFREQVKGMNRAQNDDPRHDGLKETVISGNQIRVIVTNQGSISTPDAEIANADLVWPAGPNGLGNAYEFGPIIGAEVIDADGDTVHIISDGFFQGSGGEFEPGTAGTVRWGWEPRKGFSDPRSTDVAYFSDLDRDLDGKPDSWPEAWFNETLGRYVWPAFLGDDATTPDEEVFYVMDDFDNVEFDYYPSPTDSSVRGLGLELQVRIFQFNNALAEDMIFLVYTITNVGEKDLDRVYLGMFGDPHIGGPGDFADDYAGFISPFDDNFAFDERNMLYAWDEDGIGDGGLPSGYFGYRFLESPGLENDNFDNDDDGLVDESPFNDAGTFVFRSDFGRYREPGFAWTGDEDGDWLAEFDDVGVDGIANTGDFGEGDGKPNQQFYLDVNNNGQLDSGEPTSERREPGMRFSSGEPNFGFLDIAESDQLGLTSFNAQSFGNPYFPNNDPLMWEQISTPNQRPGDPPPIIEQEADNVFIYGSGSFSLAPGESRRFSIVLLMGQDFQDLLSNARISQQIFESDYRFAQAPLKPKLVAVPGDKKVTLYWDTAAEQSFDPFVARANPDDLSKGFDFEGYRIYRSRDFSFNDTKTITDSRGVPFLSVPLNQITGVPAQFDLDNEFSGLSDIEYAGRGVRYFLGNNTGLVHSFVDSNNVKNGVKYYYAVTSYDHGDANARISPTESQRVVQQDAITREFGYDVNTAGVVAGPPASGFQGPGVVGNEDNLAGQTVGNSTGKVKVDFLEPLAVIDGKTYDITIDDVQVDSVTTALGFSVVDRDEETISFASKGVTFVALPICCAILPGSETVVDQNNQVVDTSRYEVDYPTARIRGKNLDDLPVGATYNITYRLQPVVNSLSLNGEDDTPVFNGMRVSVQDDELGLSPISTEGGGSGFKTIATNTNFSDDFTTIGIAQVGNRGPYPSDFEVRFTNYDTTATGQLINPADSSVSLGPPGAKTNFRIIDVETGEPIRFFINENIPALRNGRWDWNETIVLIRPNSPVISNTTYQVKFQPPSQEVEDDSGNVTTVFEDPVYPGEGDVFLLFSTKPMSAGDQFSYRTRGSIFRKDLAKNELDDIIVVPNPYIAYSSSEQAFRTGVRDDRRIEFRNLPETCKIRIFTIVGELVATIEKDDPTSIATWNMLSLESQGVAYGVYIFHVEAEGVGNKVGRFAIIK